MEPLQSRDKLYKKMTWCTAVFAVLCCVLCVVYCRNMTFFETHGKIGALAQQEQQALEQENIRKLMAKRNIAVTIADKPYAMLQIPLQKEIDASQISIKEEFVQNKYSITIKEAAECIQQGTELISDSAYMNGISIYQQKNDVVLELYCKDMYAYQYQTENQTLTFQFMERDEVYGKKAVIYVPQTQKDRFTSEDWKKSMEGMAAQNRCKLYFCSDLQEDYTPEMIVAYANKIHADYILAVEILENAENSQIEVLCNPTYFIPDFGSVDLAVMYGNAVKAKTSLPIASIGACSRENTIVAAAKVPSAEVKISLSDGYLKSIETEYSFYHAVMEAMEETLTELMAKQEEKK